MQSSLRWTLVGMLVFLGGCDRQPETPTPAHQREPREQIGQDTTARPLQAPDVKSQRAQPADEQADEQADQQADQQAAAMTLYRQAQGLMEAGERAEGYAVARKAKARFIAEENGLAWMLLESIELDGRRVDVHLNMGPAERNPPDNGIMRPLSFRVWSTDGGEQLLRTVDYEIGRAAGKSITAAIGSTVGSSHANYGMLPVDASYDTIRERVLDVVLEESTQAE